MDKSEAGKLGRRAVLMKYSEETRRAWCVKGAKKLNSILCNEHRRKGGLVQNIEFKSLGAINSTKQKPMTDSEALVAKRLESLGFKVSFEKSSDFEAHAAIKTSVRTFEVDFASFENDSPKIIIEVTTQKSELKGESIAYKAIKIKNDFPEAKFIAIVSKKMVSSGLRALQNECNLILFIEDLSDQEFFFPIPQGVDAAVQLDSTPENSPRKTAV